MPSGIPPNHAMSQSSSISIKCPSCGQEQEFTTWSSINVSLNPEKKNELRNGSLNRFTCESCSESSEVNYPVLYHDPDKNFMVWLNGEDADIRGLMAGDFLDEYHLRLVNSRNHLVEKTHVLEMGLDDRLLELFKASMRMGDKSIPEGDLLFAGMGSGQNDLKELQFAVVSEKETKFIGAGFKAFEEFAVTFQPMLEAEPLEATKWVQVDQAYAKALLQRHLPQNSD